jgi:hypothetical protein
MLVGLAAIAMLAIYGMAQREEKGEPTIKKWV